MKGIVLTALLLVSAARQAAPSSEISQSTLTPGINFFSPEQDIDIGNESALEAEDHLSLVQDVRLNQYVRSIAQRLLAGSVSRPGRFQFHIVNSTEAHSLGFPNGAIYIYRGLLRMTSNESEVAAIIAHEISHVVARHATSQLSRQLMVQAPVSLSAGLPMSEGWKEQLSKLGVVFGVNAPFLHYSPEQEAEAFAMTAKLLDAAKFNSDAFDNLFQRLVEASKKPDAPILTFVYNHPFPESIFNRDVDTELKPDPAPRQRVRPGSEFASFQAALRKLPAPPVETASDVADDSMTGMLAHPLNYYRLAYPDGWQVIRTSKDGAIVAPPGGLTTTTAGDDVAYGVMLDMFDLSALEKPLTLEQATNRLIVFLRQRNQTVRAVPGAQTPILIDDEPGLRTVLLRGGVIRSGNALVTEPAEVLWLVTRMYYQNLFYMVFVAPEEEFPSHQQVFEQILRNLHMR